MSIHTGSDTYGRVKTVAGIPIVTQFFMLQMFPLIPQQSYYFLGHGETQTQGVPLVASRTAREIHGIPLGNVDIASVIMAYVRGVLGLFLVIGLIGTACGAVVFLIGSPLKADQKQVLIATSILLLIAVVFGGLTYLIPLTSSRERAIRMRCAEVFGLAIDPAFVHSEVSESLPEIAAKAIGPQPSQREQLLSELIEARTRISLGEEAMALERWTDEVLKTLQMMDEAGVT